jgi:membrane-bound lytic murein transglycosylase B
MAHKTPGQAPSRCLACFLGTGRLSGCDRPVARKDVFMLIHRAVAATLTVSALVSCSAPDAADNAPEQGRGVTAAEQTPSAPEQSSGAILARLPTVPAMDDAAALARQLDDAAVTLRDRDAVTSDVRRAGEFRQLAARALATAPVAFRRDVIGRVAPSTARVTRGDVRAARLLRAMTSPQRRLPRWRIVAPPSPPVLLDLYRRAQRRTGVPWSYLAAVHLVETRMGRIRGTSTAGARGPMQFLPSTWDLYGADGDINDPRDAILAAARLLKANGAPRDMAEALWHYNPSDNYVAAVTAYARTMQRSDSAYRGYWHWRVLYRTTRGTYVLPVGYPDTRPVLLRGG